MTWEERTMPVLDELNPPPPPRTEQDELLEKYLTEFFSNNENSEVHAKDEDGIVMADCFFKLGRHECHVKIRFLPYLIRPENKSKILDEVKRMLSFPHTHHNAEWQFDEDKTMFLSLKEIVNLPN